MILKEANAEAKIEGYSPSDWAPLLSLIPQIKHCIAYDGEVYYYEFSAQIVSEFIEVVYRIPIAIGFDWPSWDEGRAMLQDTEFDFDSVDLETKCKLITAIVRNDRFNDGAIASTFRSGLMLKILRSIKKEVEAKSRD